MSEQAVRIERARVLAAATAEAMKVPVEDREFAAARYLREYGLPEPDATSLARALVAQIPSKL